MSTFLPEFWLRPLLPFNTTAIELWDSQTDFVVDILVQDAHDNDRQGSESQVEKNDVGVVKDVRAIELGVDLVPEESKRPNKVLVEMSVGISKFQPSEVFLTL